MRDEEWEDQMGRNVLSMEAAGAKMIVTDDPKEFWPSTIRGLSSGEAGLSRKELASVAALTAKRAATAIELAEEMLPYVPQYFADKWGFRERLDSLRGGE